MHIKTTIVVSVTTKVNIEGDFDSSSDLLREASFSALNTIDRALEKTGVRSLTTEGAGCLVERSALDGWFTEHGN